MFPARGCVSVGRVCDQYRLHRRRRRPRRRRTPVLREDFPVHGTEYPRGPPGVFLGSNREGWNISAPCAIRHARTEEDTRLDVPTPNVVYEDACALNELLQAETVRRRPELFENVIDAQQRGAISFEYGPDLFEWVETEGELKFVCKLVSADHASYISDADQEQHIRDMEDSAHTELYEKTIARNRNRKTRARGRTVRRKMTDRTDDGCRGCRNDSRSRRTKGELTDNTPLKTEETDLTAVETTPEVPDLSVRPVSDNNSSHDEWPTSTDDAASGYDEESC
ncbi:hypothetical protein T484DRAFT_1753477 [Baffinella frigidus]|nr:hypothetical protein T484DRAFT_1753477 [Cryptophyta sp. CCMP2293]